MLVQYKRKATNAAGIFLFGVTLLVISAVTYDNPDNKVVAFAHSAIGITMAAAYFYACWAYAKGKGYSNLLGVLLPFFNLIGLLILVSLEDKHKDGQTKLLGDNVNADAVAKESRNPATIIQKPWGAMNDKVKIALIIGSAAIICVGLWIYFSPYHSCVRDGKEPIFCAHGLPSR